MCLRPRAHCSIAAGLTLGFFVSFAVAQDSLNVRTVGRLHSYRPGMVEVAGNYLLVHEAYEDWWLYDITQTGSMQRGAPFGLSVGKIAVDGNFLYSADSVGLRVINIADPLQPSVVGQVNQDFHRGAIHIAAGNGFAAVQCQFGVYVFNVSNPVQPSAIGEVWYSANDSDYNGLTIAGAYAFATGCTGVVVIDLLNPTMTYPVEGPVSSVSNAAVSGQWLCIAYWDSLRIFDATNPLSAVRVGACASPGDLVALRWPYCYVSGTHRGVRVVNVSNPALPVEVMQDTTVKQITDWIVADGFLYATSPDRGLGKYSLQNPASPVRVGWRESFNYLLSAGTVGSFLFSADPYVGLRVFDVSDPTAPVLAGAFQSWWQQGTDAAVSGNYAVLTDWTSGPYVVDITNPPSPVELAHINGVQAQHLAVSGNTVYFAELGRARVSVWDISNPAAPVFLNNLHPLSARAIAAFGDFLYVGDWGGLQIVRVSDPVNPVLLGWCSVSCMEEVAVEGVFAYVVSRPGGLKVVDISDPWAPHVVGELPTEDDVVSVAARWPYVFVGGQDTVLRIIDVSEPSAPVLAGFYGAEDYGFGVAVRDSLVYVAGYDNLWVFDYSQVLGNSPSLSALPAQCSLLPCYPNPFNPTTTVRFVLPHAARVDLTIFDVTGRLVQRMAGRTFDAGEHQIPFNGSALTSGMYLLRMQSSNFSASQKIVLMK